MYWPRERDNYMAGGVFVRTSVEGSLREGTGARVPLPRCLLR